MILDVFTRAVRGWHLSRSLSHELTRAALRQARTTHLPRIQHADQGVHYAAQGYLEVLRQQAIQIRMAAGGQPTHTAFAARFMRT